VSPGDQLGSGTNFVISESLIERHGWQVRISIHLDHAVACRVRFHRIQQPPSKTAPARLWIDGNMTDVPARRTKRRRAGSLFAPTAYTANCPLFTQNKVLPRGDKLGIAYGKEGHDRVQNFCRVVEPQFAIRTSEQRGNLLSIFGS